MGGLTVGDLEFVAPDALDWSDADGGLSRPLPERKTPDFKFADIVWLSEALSARRSVGPRFGDYGRYNVPYRFPWLRLSDPRDMWNALRQTTSRTGIDWKTRAWCWLDSERVDGLAGTSVTVASIRVDLARPRTNSLVGYGDMQVLSPLEWSGPSRGTPIPGLIQACAVPQSRWRTCNEDGPDVAPRTAPLLALFSDLMLCTSSGSGVDAHHLFDVSDSDGSDSDGSDSDGSDSDGSDSDGSDSDVCKRPYPVARGGVVQWSGFWTPEDDETSNVPNDCYSAPMTKYMEVTLDFDALNAVEWEYQGYFLPVIHKKHEVDGYCVRTDDDQYIWRYGFLKPESGERVVTLRADFSEFVPPAVRPAVLSSDAHGALIGHSVLGQSLWAGSSNPGSDSDYGDYGRLPGWDMVDAMKRLAKAADRFCAGNEGICTRRGYEGTAGSWYRCLEYCTVTRRVAIKSVNVSLRGTSYTATTGDWHSSANQVVKTGWHDFTFPGEMKSHSRSFPAERPSRRYRITVGGRVPREAAVESMIVPVCVLRYRGALNSAASAFSASASPDQESDSDSYGQMEQGYRILDPGGLVDLSSPRWTETSDDGQGNSIWEYRLSGDCDFAKAGDTRGHPMVDVSDGSGSFSADLVVFFVKATGLVVDRDSRQPSITGVVELPARAFGPPGGGGWHGEASVSLTSRYDSGEEYYVPPEGPEGGSSRKNLGSGTVYLEGEGSSLEGIAGPVLLTFSFSKTVVD